MYCGRSCEQKADSGPSPKQYIEICKFLTHYPTFFPATGSIDDGSNLVFSRFRKSRIQRCTVLSDHDVSDSFSFSSCLSTVVRPNVVYKIWYITFTFSSDTQVRTPFEGCAVNF